MTAIKLVRPPRNPLHTHTHTETHKGTTTHTYMHTRRTVEGAARPKRDADEEEDGEGMEEKK